MDELARRWSIQFQPGKGSVVYTESSGKDALLVKPTTGMNASGVAVKTVVRDWNIDLADLNIVIDDVDLPLGSIRIRPKGGDGCHRGMESIIYQLQSDQFPRVRLGIGTDENMRPAEKYVLKPFRSDDELEAEAMVKHGADALENLLVRGLNHTMNHFNS